MSKTRGKGIKNLKIESAIKNKIKKRNFKLKRTMTKLTAIALATSIVTTILSDYKYLRNSIVDNNDNLISFDVSEFDDLKYLVMPKYKSNFFDSISDSGNVYIHNISNIITNYIKSKLSKKEYKFLCECLKNKKIKDIITEDGFFNVEIVNKDFIYSDIEIFDLKEKLKKCKFYDDFNFYNDAILESMIVEVVTDSSGFDALVLEKNGDYFITNTCCGENEKQDILMIAYDIVKRIVGNEEFYLTVAPMIFGKNASFEIPKEYEITYEDIISAKNYYQGQRTASCKLIKKYLMQGKNVKLGGYSLGAGIMLDSYILLCSANPRLGKEITITLYNPYIGLIEGQNSKIEIESFANKYKDNIKIYSAEGDVVSQFNNIINLFGDNVIYLKGNSNIDYHLKNLNVMNLVMSEKSRHSIYGVDYNFFDQNGNVLVRGKQITLNEIANGTVKSNSIESLIEDAFKNDISLVRDTINNIDLGENEYMRPYIIEMYDSLFNYFENNIGHFDYDRLIDTITPSITKIMHKSVERKSGWFLSSIMNYYSNEENINNYMKNYFLTVEGKNKIGAIIQSILNNDTDEVIKKLIDLGTNIYLKADNTGINILIYVLSECFEFEEDKEKVKTL